MGVISEGALSLLCLSGISVSFYLSLCRFLKVYLF